MSDLERMKELVEILDEAARAYYQESRELMPNLEYDALEKELKALEEKTGTILAKSPTARVGYEILSSLPKEQHASPMLSLDKTKEAESLQSFLGEQEGVLSWKLDGLTIVLTYEKGVLKKAVTRGNGIEGEVITANARQFMNLPAKIPFDGELVLRGEAIISYSDFEKINSQIEEEGKYKNPRNLCSGSVRQLNSEITAGRRVQFFAFALISAEKEGERVEFNNSHEVQFEWLQKQGFHVVPWKHVNAKNISEAIEVFSEEIKTFDLPSDGLVLLMDDIAYGESLGTTAKFPRNAMAFKWKDEQAETRLLEMEWSPSRTGLINPVAIFEPVELEGTTVSRASVHNLSIVEGLELGIGDTITVFKANMIIPQIAENLTKSGHLEIPKVCPVCGEPTEIRNQSEDVRVLCCPNPKCTVKKIKSFELFVSRNAMNIDGLSTATAEKLIDKGFIHSLADIYHLDRYRDEIVAMEGFGEKSYQNMIDSIEKSREVSLGAFIYALGISGIGTANGKMLAKAFGNSLEKLRAASVEELMEIDGIGDVTAADIAAYFADEEKQEELDALLKEVQFTVEESKEALIFEGKTFVITGSVEHFANRNALKAYIEERGGKVSGSVSSKTSYLINNEAESKSSKNKKAKELSIPILTEDAFLRLVDEYKTKD